MWTWTVTVDREREHHLTWLDAIRVWRGHPSKPAIVLFYNFLITEQLTHYHSVFSLGQCQDAVWIMQKTALLLRKSPSKSRSHIQMNLKYILWDCIWRERERGRKVKRCVCGRGGGGILSLEDLWGFTKHLNNVQDVMQRNIEDPKWKTLASMYRP